MKKIIQISNVYQLPQYGVIGCGTNWLLDALDDEQIKNIVGQKVFICSKEGTISSLEVEIVEISTSLTGKKNICISFGSKIAEDELSNCEILSFYQ